MQYVTLQHQSNFPPGRLTEKGAAPETVQFILQGHST